MREALVAYSYCGHPFINKLSSAPTPNNHHIESTTSGPSLTRGNCTLSVLLHFTVQPLAVLAPPTGFGPTSTTFSSQTQFSPSERFSAYVAELDALTGKASESNTTGEVESTDSSQPSTQLLESVSAHVAELATFYGKASDSSTRTVRVTRPTSPLLPYVKPLVVWYGAIYPTFVVSAPCSLLSLVKQLGSPLSSSLINSLLPERWWTFYRAT
jgi:hypothetical protein